jgi:hypothetical protein
MGIIGYAAALEQFHPSELLNYSISAAQHGFKAVMAADHFQPWSPSKGTMLLCGAGWRLSVPPPTI